MAAKSTKLNLVSSNERRNAGIPRHLGTEGRRLWSAIMAAYSITDPGGQALLQTACESADRIASVRVQIDRDGELLMVRGVPRCHPLCSVERDQRAALTRAIKSLNLDLEPLKAPGRPPTAVGISMADLA